jgi:hypothetical protein
MGICAGECYIVGCGVRFEGAFLCAFPLFMGCVAGLCVFGL